MAEQVIRGYHDVLRDEIHCLLPDTFSVVMDLGCGTGTTSLWLKEKFPGVVAIGVESNIIAAEQASQVLDEIIMIDLDEDRRPLSKYNKSVDVLPVLDVLEHLVDPWSCLKEVTGLLSDQGVAIVSLPNVRNIKVLGPLLIGGQWKYVESGILDKTHLRFFTLRSMKQLLNSAGLEIDRIISTGPTRISHVKSFGGRLAWVANMLSLGLLEEFIAHQFIARERLYSDTSRSVGKNGV